MKARAKKLGVLPNYKAQAQKAAREAKTLKELIENYEPHVVLQYIPALPEEEIEPEALRRFLLKNTSTCTKPQARSPSGSRSFVSTTGCASGARTNQGPAGGHGHA